MFHLLPVGRVPGICRACAEVLPGTCRTPVWHLPGACLTRVGCIPTAGLSRAAIRPALSPGPAGGVTAAPPVAP